MPNFGNGKVSDVNIYDSRMFLQGSFSELQHAPLAEERTVPSEYYYLLMLRHIWCESCTLNVDTEENIYNRRNICLVL